MAMITSSNLPLDSAQETAYIMLHLLSEKLYIPQLISSFVKIFCSALAAPYDIAEAALLDSLIAKAKFENNRYQKPKKKPKVSTEYVDWV
ncbi:hypothetical protein GW17_00026703 [Ensete ventricosum]|nr:hypothetical protein GW17_00026703 [Ensete ventricosum]